MNTRFDPQNAAGNSATRHPYPIGSPHVQKATVEETATEARQGSWGKPVLVVLVCGLVLTMLAWGAAEWWGEATDPPAQQTATPPAGSTAPGGSGPAAPSNAPVTTPSAPATDQRPSGNP